jgi:transcriptional regulator
MYLPKHFEEARADVLHELMRAHPLATLVTLSSGGLSANHIPLELVPASDAAPHGLLRGHVARANPLWRDHATDTEALAIFHGPNAYVSPSWYATKRETGRSVPTWNYVVVHARGPLRVIDDPVWLRAHLMEMTERHEAKEAEPWSLADAPAPYVEKQLAAIVGIELRITALSGKWKVSQNQPERNRAGVVEGLSARGSEGAAALAELVRAHAPREGQ